MTEPSWDEMGSASPVIHSLTIKIEALQEDLRVEHSVSRQIAILKQLRDLIQERHNLFNNS